MSVSQGWRCANGKRRAEESLRTKKREKDYQGHRILESWPQGRKLEKRKKDRNVEREGVSLTPNDTGSLPQDRSTETDSPRLRRYRRLQSRKKQLAKKNVKETKMDL